VFFIVACLVLAMATGFAGADARQKDITAKIGHPFTAGGKTLAAGSYQIVSRPTPGAGLIIRSKQGGESVQAPVITRLARTSDKEPTEPKLVFDRVGDAYVLSEVWIPGEDGYLLAGTQEEHQHSVEPVK
jgi:hypothetical protein